MFALNPNAFYKADELAQLFDAMGVNWDRLSARLKITRVHARVMWGKHIIDALNGYVPQQEPGGDPVAPDDDTGSDEIDDLLSRIGVQRARCGRRKKTSGSGSARL